MSVPFAINGLGRIGRAALRIARERGGLELVAVNDLATAEQLSKMIAHDTLHGHFDGEVSADGDHLVIDGREIRVFRQAEPEKIPWEKSGAAVVIDATGKCLDRECAENHLRGPVRKVIVSANAVGMDLTLCLGVNHQSYEPESHHLLSAASCTTNCLAPIAWLLHREFTLLHAMLNTVHSYNNDQSLLEAPHQDARRARAAALNMIPTTTSAIQATARILPQLEGRLDGLAIRVPTPDVSLIDLVAILEAGPAVDDINQLFRRAAAGELAGVLAVTDEELVSSDFLRDPHSAIVDLPLTREVGRRLYRIVAWYDNEWGHASRLIDLVSLVGERLA